jgi:redox-sensitive bicupin YhaK (pirin superfamily)
MHGFQIWINLPKKFKMSDPDYQDVPSSKIPEHSLGQGSIARVICGEAYGITGPVKVLSPVQYIDYHLEPNTATIHQFPK